MVGLIGNLNDYGNMFHGAARNMRTGAKIPGNIINGLLLARKYGTEKVKFQFWWSQTTQWYRNIIEKKKQKGNIYPQRRPLGCWIIC